MYIGASEKPSYSSELDSMPKVNDEINPLNTIRLNIGDIVSLERSYIFKKSLVETASMVCELGSHWASSIVMS
jgi:hypothetical protein